MADTTKRHAVAARTALTNWATLTAGQKDTAQKRTIQGVLDLSECLEVVLRQQRQLVVIPETQ